MARTQSLPEGLFAAEDGRPRCRWCEASAEYRRYHDEEWGFPVVDERRLFEKLCLEGFQAGLSWLTILNKRPAFREVFHGFDAERVARFGERDIERLLGDPRIVRHRGKIEATIGNAQALLRLKDEVGSFAGWVWRHEPAADQRPKRYDWATLRQVTESSASQGLSRELKKRGFRFVGATTVYAFMQAMGLVNDHVAGCHVRDAALAARRALVLPG